MELSHVIAERRIDEELALRAVVEGTASETGKEFYRALVRNLAQALDTYGAWLTEYDEQRDRLRALAFWFGDEWIDGFEYGIAGTPCETTVRERRMVHIPDRVVELYPNGEVKFPARAWSATSASPARRRPARARPPGGRGRPAHPPEKRLLALFQIFAIRALAEIRRVRVEEELRERQEKLTGLIGSAMDGIVEMDGELRISMMNAAAEKLFACAAADRLVGCGIDALVGKDATATLRALADELDVRTGTERYLWIPGGSPPNQRPKAIPGRGDAVAVRGPGRLFIRSS
jgi:PAS domain-containing protein